MSSVVDICNVALSHLGDSATVSSIDPPEGSAQAEHCATFYPIARDSLMELHPWKFSTRRATLSLLSEDTYGWQYAYAKPSGAIKILAVLSVTDDGESESQPYELEINESGTEMILTNQEDAVVRYQVRVTDTTKFSPLCVDALGRLLASYLAGTIIKGDAGAKESKAQYSFFRAVLSQAIESDANQRKKRDDDHTPSWIGGR